MDSRPSDAISMAIQCQAPVYLNKALLEKRGVPIKAVAEEIKNGVADVLRYHARAKTSTMIGNGIGEKNTLQFEESLQPSLPLLSPHLMPSSSFDPTISLLSRFVTSPHYLSPA